MPAARIAAYIVFTFSTCCELMMRLPSPLSAPMNISATITITSADVVKTYDGNLTAAHLYTTARIVDDHTVGVPAGTDADRPAGLFVGLDGSYAWILILPEAAKRGPITVTLTSTNGAMAAAADDAAVKVEGEKIGDDVRAIHAALVLLGFIAPAA